MSTTHAPRPPGSMRAPARHRRGFGAVARAPHALTVLVALALLTATPACGLTALAVGAIVTLARGGKHNKARMRLDRSPAQIAIALQALEPELHEWRLDRIDLRRKGAIVEASVPRQSVEITIKIREVGPNVSDVTVTADAGERWITHHDLAVRVLESICRLTRAKCERQELRRERRERRKAPRSPGAADDLDVVGAGDEREDPAAAAAADGDE